MKKLGTGLLLATMLCGCASPPRRTILIDSDPQGVRVEVNNAYLGKTPTSYTLESNKEGEFLGSWANAPVVEFVATPPSDMPGLYVQRKQFNPNGFFRAGDKIPEKMFFDMRRKQEGFSIGLTPAKKDQ
jgi:hypothetical protein